jgi:hypothetical protein
MLETLIDELSPEQEKGPEQPAPLSVPIGEPSENIVEKTATVIDEDDTPLHQLIETIQQVFNTRIERILGTGGGLLVVVDQVNDGDEQAAQDLSQHELPVAVIDTRTFRSLKRLGVASPVAETRTLFESEQTAQQPENPLLKLSQEKLHSAEVLLQQGCTVGVMDLLASALLQKVAGLNDQTQAPTIDASSVWLYTEIVPAQILTQEQASILVRIISLSQSPTVPEVLIEQSLTDAKLLFSVLD